MDLNVFQALPLPVGGYMNKIMHVGEEFSVRIYINPYPVPSMLCLVLPNGPGGDMMLYIDEANDLLAYRFLLMLAAARKELVLPEDMQEEVEHAKAFLRAWGNYCSCRNSHRMRDNPLNEGEGPEARSEQENRAQLAEIVQQDPLGFRHITVAESGGK